MTAREKQYFEFGAFRIDVGERILVREGEVVPLTPKVFDTLLFLVENSGRILTKEEVMAAVWPDTAVEDANLTRNVSTLRKALGDTADEGRYVETIPWRGYRFAAIVREVRSEVADLVIEERSRSTVVVESEHETESDRDADSRMPAPSDGQPAGYLGSGRPVRRWLLGAASILAMAAIAAAVYLARIERPKAASAGATIRSIAVLPFESLDTNTRDEYLELGMTDTLIVSLSGLQRIIVRPTSAVRKYAGRLQDPIAAGREQQVDAVLEGSIQRSEGKIRVTARLVRVEDGSSIWADKFDESYGDIFGLQDSIAARLVGALALRLTGDEQARLTKHYTQNTEAYNLYLKGRYFVDKRIYEEARKGVEYIEQATQTDPNYAMAFVGLAEGYFALGGLGGVDPRETVPRAKTAALHALELDQNLADAHAALGQILHMYEWDWSGAERELRRALELDPNSSVARQHLGLLLVDTGRFDEAADEMARAIEIDPLSLPANRDLGQVLFFSGQYDPAIKQLLKAHDLDPNFATVHHFLSRCYESKGLYQQAVDADLESRRETGYAPAAMESLRNAYRKTGWKGYWQSQLRLLAGNEKDSPIAGRSYWEPYLIALMHARLGNRKQALDWLGTAFEKRSVWIPTVRNEPLWLDYRSDARFIDLFRRVNLP
jgi:DNA-binding winged helix-turn-helix (wHTH) protein/TolB-like protein